MKDCNRCKITKSLEEFPKRTYKSGKVGVEPNCLACKRELNRNRNRKKRENKEFRKLERKQNLQRRLKNPVKEMFQRSKKRASRKNLVFTITEKDVVIPKVCPLLNIPLSVQTGKANDNSPSLDRVDTTKGYTPDNIRVISRLANIMKAHATKEQLKLFSKNIISYIG